MKRTRFAALAACLAFAVCLAGAALAQDPSQTIMNACTKCHNAKRICSNLGGKDMAGWEATVGRMISKGAAVSDKDKPAVVTWLSTQKAGAKPVCE